MFPRQISYYEKIFVWQYSLAELDSFTTTRSSARCNCRAIKPMSFARLVIRHRVGGGGWGGGVNRESS